MTACRMSLAYFGKVPSRGDFIRSAHSAGLVETLDRWITGAMDQLGGDSRWKLVYDAAVPVPFAFVGPRSTAAIAGLLLPSRDASGRRFPFVAAGAFDVMSPGAFAARSPMALARVWSRLRALGQRCVEADDITPLQRELALAQIEVACDAVAYDAPWRDFLDICTLRQMDQRLSDAGHEASLRQTLLGLGLLLEPLERKPAQPVGKGLLLPMVPDLTHAALLGAWWLHLVMPFVSASDVEIGLLLPQAEPSQMLLCFNGASTQGLVAALAHRTAHDHFIDARQAQWVEACVQDQARLRLLSDHLREPDLSLRRAFETFKETFQGPAHASHV